MSEEIGKIVSDKEPTIYEAEIKLNTPKVQPLEYVVAKFREDESEYGVIMRIVNIRERNKYATSDVFDVEEKTGVSVYPEYIRSQLIGQYLVADGEIIDVYKIDSSGKFQTLGPIKPPRAASKVYRADKNTVRTLIGTVENPLRLGYLIGTQNIDVAIDVNALTRHMIIVGGTGTGKSYFRGILMELLYELNIPQINFDVLNEYEMAVRELGGKNLRLGIDYRPRLDYLSPNEFERMIEQYVPTPFQRMIARQGFTRFAEASTKSLVPLQPINLEEYIKKAANDYNAGLDTRENTISRVNAFLQDFNIFGEGIKWDDLLKKYKIVNILFGYASEPVLRIGISAALKEIMAARINGLIPPLIVSFDEAHVLIPRGRTTVTSAVIKRLLRYGRHLGIGIMMITQRPSSVDGEAISMPATRVFFATDPRELKDLRSMFQDLGDYIFSLIPRLEVGTAVITGTMDVLRHSLYVRIPSERKTTHGGYSPKLIEG